MDFYTLQGLLGKGYSASAVRWLLLSAHYRTQLNFTLSGLDAAEKTIAYYRGIVARLDAASGEAKAAASIEDVGAFEAAMDEDLNVSKALAVVNEAAKAANRALDDGAMARESASAARAFIGRALGETFGIDLSSSAEAAPSDVQALADERQAAREAKDWPASDRLRDAIAAKGWLVEDTPQGPKLKKA